MQPERGYVCAKHLKRIGRNLTKFQIGCRTGMRRFSFGKGIIETAPNPLFHRQLTIQRKCMPQIKWKQTDVIQTHQVVAVIVRK